jgi:Zn-dependent peptidase ImmA (M78 family)
MKRIHATLMVVVLMALLASCDRATPTTPPSPTAVAPTPTTAAQAPTRTPRPAQSPTVEAAATPGSEQDELLAAMDAIGAEMETMRGLDATQPISNNLMSRSELADYMQQEIDREYTPEELENDTRVMAAFDFIPEDYDLRGELLELYSTQVAGFYDDEQNTLYVVSDSGLDLLARMTLAHEITHGLQDERFNLNTFLDEDRMSDDEILARQALAEGDATLAMTEYMMNHLSDITEEDIAALQSEEVQESEQQLAEAPAIIRETLNFPYTYGEAFVSALYEEGWDAVDAAYADPPLTTEQILHPEKYFTRDEPQVVALPPLTDTLGSSWHLADDGTLGEFQMQVYLAQQLDQDIADAASAGWDGDQYAVYVNGDDEVLVLSTVWDSLADQNEFTACYTQYAEAKYGQPGKRSGNAILWETPTQTAYLGWDGVNALIILGPDRATVDKVLSAIEPR